jgi:hypothetical protein
MQLCEHLLSATRSSIEVLVDEGKVVVRQQVVVEQARKVNIHDVIVWLDRAWTALDSNILRRCWIKTGTLPDAIVAELEAITLMARAELDAQVIEQLGALIADLNIDAEADRMDVFDFLRYVSITSTTYTDYIYNITCIIRV